MPAEFPGQISDTSPLAIRHPMCMLYLVVCCSKLILAGCFAGLAPARFNLKMERVV